MPYRRLPIIRPVRIALLVCVLPLLVGCAARQAQDSLAGATAQRLVSYSIEDVISNLPASDFEPLAGQRVRLESHFAVESAIQEYADQRLAVALAHRFGIEVVDADEESDAIVNVFYTALGTNRDTKGFYLPVGFVPGFDDGAKIDILTIEQFHGLAELYYFVGPNGTEKRGRVVQSRTRADAIGLPIITIPLTDMKRD